MAEVDYIGQLLIGRSNNLKENSIITIDGINANFQKLQDRVMGVNGYKNEIRKQEVMALIKLAYINIMSTIAKMYGEEIPGTYEEFDKTEVKQAVIEAERELKQEIIAAEEQNAENRRVNNEYRKLLVRQRINIQEVERKYLEYLRLANSTLDEQIRRGNYNLEKSREQERIVREKARAFELLSDPEYKMRLDDLLLFNFSPNQEELYVPRSVTEVTYMPQKPRKERDLTTGQEYQTLNSIRFGNIAAGDQTETVAIHIGNLGFGMFRQSNTGKITYRDPRKVKMYIVLKKYADKQLAAQRKEEALKSDSMSRWDAQTDSEIFLVSGTLHEELLRKPDIDPEFVRYTQDVLLSATNLEVASQYNGGYIGEVGLTPNREDYMVIHDKEALSISTEFQNAARLVGDKKGLETKALIYKIDQRKIEVYDRNSQTGKLDRTVISAPALPTNPTNKVKKENPNFKSHKDENGER